MLRKRKSYWIIVDDKFIKGWRKLDLCETKDEAHIWKCEKTVNKYRDIVSEKYLENEVLVNSLYAVAINPDHKEIEKEEQEKILDQNAQETADEIDKEILENVHKAALNEEDKEVIEEPTKELAVEEEKGTEIDEPEEVKTFKEYLTDDEELKDDDFDFNIED